MGTAAGLQFGAVRPAADPALPPAKTGVCPAPAPAKSTYDVSAVAASLVIEGGKLFYNSRGLESGEGSS